MFQEIVSVPDQFLALDGNPPAPACQGHPAVKIESSLSSLVTSFLSDGLQVCFPVRCTVQLSAVCCLAVCITY